MKWLSKFVSASVICLMMASCSTPAYVQQDDSVNLSNYKTYMWVDTRASENDSAARSISYADIPVRNEANKALQEAGWREVDDNPDAIIGYDVLVERTSDVRSDHVYSQPYRRTYFNRFTRRWNVIYFPSQFMGYDTYDVPAKEGTVTISIMDAHTDKNIWQGWTTMNINYSRLTSDEISRGVRKIFNKFSI